MEPKAIHPLDRMKPQRGRRLDEPAPVVVVPAPRTPGLPWRPAVLACAGVILALGGCVFIAG